MKLAILCEEYMTLLCDTIFSPIDGLLDEPGQIGNSIRKGSV